jgi:TatD DNase family protein
VKGGPSCRFSFPCASLRRGELPLFDELLLQGRYIGEIGPDEAPEFRSTWKDQMTVFEHILTQSQFADGRIMSIHSRRTSRAVLDCIEKFPQAGLPILHWFSGSLGDLDRAIELRCWFSAGPAMLASVKGRHLADRMPQDRVVTETDGPFAQFEGRRIVPWDVEHASSSLAQIWNLDEDFTKQLIQDNFQTLCAESPALHSVPIQHGRSFEYTEAMLGNGLARPQAMCPITLSLFDPQVTDSTDPNSDEFSARKRMIVST